jgi:dihydroorotase
LEEVLKQIQRMLPENILGSSTGNMLVDNEATLEKYSPVHPCLLAVHCEDETTIQNNLAKYKEEFERMFLVTVHHLIRSEEALYFVFQSVV